MIGLEICALFLALLLIFAWWWRTRVQTPLQEMEAAVERLRAGHPPGPFPSDGAPAIQSLAGELALLAREHTGLRHQITQEEFNLQVILSSMTEGVMVVDAELVIRLANQSLHKLFNLQASPLGQTVLGALREAAIQEMIRAALADGALASREIALNYSHAQNTTRYLSASAVPMRNPEGAVAGAVIIFHDVSRLRQLEEVRKDFVANVSHELRTPLSIFHGYLENLLDNPTLPRKELAPILEVMKRHSDRLNALLEDLLALARLESRQERISRAPFDLEPFLRSVVADWNRKVASKNITIAIETAPDLPPLEADMLRMEQVLNNLIENAVKYTDHDGRIAITAEHAHGRLRLGVSDNGVGISPADLPHIFERFYRVEKGRSREHGGTGLGLSIVKHIAQLHGGTVHAESTYGAGTKITLDLPQAG